MSEQAVLYRHAVPVSKERHATSFIDTSQDSSFSNAANPVRSIPTEFPFATGDYVVVPAGEATPIGMPTGSGRSLSALTRQRQSGRLL